MIQSQRSRFLPQALLKHSIKGKIRSVRGIPEGVIYLGSKLTHRLSGHRKRKELPEKPLFLIEGPFSQHGLRIGLWKIRGPHRPEPISHQHAITRSRKEGRNSVHSPAILKHAPHVFRISPDHLSPMSHILLMPCQPSHLFKNIGDFKLIHRHARKPLPEQLGKVPLIAPL